MRRREFITLLGGAAAAWPLAARAQQPGKLPTIGFLGQSTPSAESHWIAAFVQRLRELGWIEGRTVAIEFRWAEGRSERFAEIAAEFVRLKVDVIVTSGTAQSSRQSRRHRSSRSSSRRRGTRLAPALSRVWRDRAATSPACRSSGPILPASGSNSCARLSRVSAGWRSWPMSVIPSPCWRWARLRRQRARSASRSPRSKSGERRISRPPSRRSRAARRRFMLLSDALVNTHRIHINTLALGARLPTMHGFRDYVEAGGLMSYGANYPDLFRRAADYVDKIFKGAKPADLPVQQPTKFELVINLKTAKALGLDHPADAARPRRRGDRISAPAASWCDPAGGSPAQVRGSVRLVASVAWPLATVVAKRTQRLHGVWD